MLINNYLRLLIFSAKKIPFRGKFFYLNERINWADQTISGRLHELTLKLTYSFDMNKLTTSEKANAFIFFSYLSFPRKAFSFSDFTLTIL